MFYFHFSATNFAEGTQEHTNVEQLYKLIERFKFNGPALLAMMRIVRHMPPAFSKHSSPGRHYSSASVIMGGYVDIQDPALNLFLRAILEGQYRSVIEIGAYSGERIITLKRLIQDIDAWGLDIVQEYRSPFEREAVKFEHFSLDFFRSVPLPALVCSRGTLTCMKEDDVVSFFQQLAHQGLDIVLYEPAGYKNRPYGLMRSPSSYYHPYDRLLRSAGLTPDSDFEQATLYNFNLSMMEAWYSELARSGSQEV